MTDITATTHRPRVRRSALALSVLVASLGTSAANVALPTISVDLDGTFAHTQWVALAYLLAMTSTSLTVGHLGDRLGRQRMLLAGVAVFTAAALGAAFAPTLDLLIAARDVQGIGAAVMMALPLAVARDSVPTERLGATMGMLGTTAAVGTASGPALGGALIGFLGWPAIFAVMAPLGALVLVLLGRPERSSPAPTAGRSSFDALGVLLLTIAVALYTLGVTDLSGSEPWWPGALLGGAAVALTLFVRRELRATHPLLPMALLRTPGIAAGAVLNLVVGTVMMSTLVVGPFFLSGALGLTPAAVGAVMAAGPLASICTGMLAGRTVDRFGPRAMTSAGLCAMVVGSLALALLPGTWGLIGYMTGTVLLAPGYQLFLAANSTAVLTAIPAERRGTASGLLQLARNLGLVTGSSVLASLFAATAGTAVLEASAEQLTGALRATFVVTAAALAGAVVLSLIGARRRTPTAEETPRARA